ncbi:MFS transporter [Paenibacillus sp. MMS20-IR301]|uniref:MFS transporter n=1 Tax=Paenibacillus sp. MMS20-IR301 TaxID=2895946 RepID=UPI0028EC70F7|nr:MFS transporter [Paenibacillus sp. MMS20-IR301]WNS45298.1 MFS transporter [Paenibacillus sp. MMS20-IR301]
MDITKSKSGAKQAFTRLAVIVFFIEWIRGAVLVAFLPATALSGTGLSVSVVGVAVSVHYLTDSIIKGFVGYLLDRFSGKLILHIGFIIGVAGILLMITTHNPWVLIGASACLGAGFSPIWILCMSQIEQENRAQRMGMLYVYWMAGLGLGPVMMNFILGRSVELSLLFIILFLAAGWMVAAFIQLDQIVVPQVKSSLGKQFNTLWHKIKRGGFLVPGMFLQTMAGGMLVPLLTSFAVKHLGLSHSQLSVVMLTGGAGVILLLVPMGKWFDRVGGRWFLVLGFAMFALGLFGLTSVSSFTGAIVLAVLLGSGYAALLPSWNALMARYIPQESASVSWGILFSIEGLGVVIGPLIGSWLVSFGNELLPFQVSACLFGIISIVYLLSPARLFPRKENQAKLQTDTIS